MAHQVPKLSLPKQPITKYNQRMTIETVRRTPVTLREENIPTVCRVDVDQLHGSRSIVITSNTRPLATDKRSDALRLAFAIARAALTL